MYCQVQAYRLAMTLEPQHFHHQPLIDFQLVKCLTEAVDLLDCRRYLLVFLSLDFEPLLCLNMNWNRLEQV